MPTHGKTTTSTNGRELVLERIINAPREKVFKAWTDPELMKQRIINAPREKVFRPGPIPS
jgi:uncharacterized protein YndB with AHSA1/START domain